MKFRAEFEWEPDVDDAEVDPYGRLAFELTALGAENLTLDVIA